MCVISVRPHLTERGWTWAPLTQRRASSGQSVFFFLCHNHPIMTRPVEDFCQSGFGVSVTQCLESPKNKQEVMAAFCPVLGCLSMWLFVVMEAGLEWEHESDHTAALSLKSVSFRWKSIKLTNSGNAKTNKETVLIFAGKTYLWSVVTSKNLFPYNLNFDLMFLCSAVIRW